MKFRDNRIRKKKSVKFVKFDVELFDRRRSKHELVQEMMCVNTCVKFHSNRLRNEGCRAVTPFEYEQTYEHTYVRADPYIPCEGIITYV